MAGRRIAGGAGCKSIGRKPQASVAGDEALAAFCYFVAETFVGVQKIWYSHSLICSFEYVDLLSPLSEAVCSVFEFCAKVTDQLAFFFFCYEN